MTGVVGVSVGIGGGIGVGVELQHTVSMEIRAEATLHMCCLYHVEHSVTTDEYTGMVRVHGQLVMARKSEQSVFATSRVFSFSNKLTERGGLGHSVGHTVVSDGSWLWAVRGVAGHHLGGHDGRHGGGGVHGGTVSGRVHWSDRWAV